jgi:signal transduction histidine kinase
LREGDDIIGAIEISRDITGDINAQKAMMRQEKLASIGRLSAGVAHEINNPLTTILTTAMLIQEDLDPQDENYKELETITKETLRCRKIVASLLDFARQSEPSKKENDINDIIRESMVLTKKQAAFKDVALVCELTADIPTVLVDKGQIQQALINLIINAIEANDSGGKIMITSGYDPRAHSIEVQIIDSGIGISTDDMDRLFDPFFTTKEEGTGLGLAITHGIIEQHGGTVEVESKIGQGTNFKIKLPDTIPHGKDNAA